MTKMAWMGGWTSEGFGHKVYSKDSGPKHKLHRLASREEGIEEVLSFLLSFLLLFIFVYIWYVDYVCLRFVQPASPSELSAQYFLPPKISKTWLFALTFTSQRSPSQCQRIKTAKSSNGNAMPLQGNAKEDCFPAV